MNRILSLFAFSLVFSLLQFAHAQDSKLSIYYMDVGQADGIVIKSPKGEYVLIDGGVDKDGNCLNQIAFMRKIGMKKINYMIASHYHSDHIGCTKNILDSFPLTPDAKVYDRGNSYKSSTYNEYVAKINGHRVTADQSTSILLDKGDVKIDVVALNGNGIETTNENDLSVVCVLHYGQFDAEFGGDLSGVNTNSYEDIETSVAPKVGQIEVYKVHHHCSAYSSNETWLDCIKPKVAIISVGDKNDYGHPAEECLERLHDNTTADIYLTEIGKGGAIDTVMDKVWGNITVTVEKGGAKFTVQSNKGTKNYDSWPVSGTSKYFWSKNSNVYHKNGCPSIGKINPDNLMKSNDVPKGKSLAKDCQGL